MIDLRRLVIDQVKTTVSTAVAMSNPNEEVYYYEDVRTSPPVVLHRSLPFLSVTEDRCRADLGQSRPVHPLVHGTRQVI